MKVLTLVGTRPEVIRLSRLIPLLDESTDHILVHTGQNSHRQLNEVFFEQLGIRSPNHQFAVNTSSLGTMLGDIFRCTDQVLDQEVPDAFLVLGDTNSALSAMMAKRRNVPVYHMEAGNRCFDANVPEETNRRVIDHLSDFNLAYTEHARRNLLAEGISPQRILVTGSPMREVINHYFMDISMSDVLEREGLENQRFILVSAHRQETVDSPMRLTSFLSCLRTLKDEWGYPIVVSTHPRTRDNLERLGGYESTGIRFHEPFGFFDYCKLQTSAFCVVSDSGTVGEEASILRFPAVTTRSSIERPEVLDSGGLIMTDLRPDDLVSGIRAARAGFDRVSAPLDYIAEDTSIRVRNFILSTAREHRVWAGLR